MKKILYFAACCAAVAALSTSCHKKTVAATAGAAARHYAEHIKNDNYDAFVKAIHFTEPVAPGVRRSVDRAHATALRTVHHPNVTERGGIREVRVVSEKMMPDNKNCEVVLTNHYGNGTVETVNYHMVKNDSEWKIRETPNKELWRATTSDGDHEVIKVRAGHERDFVKDKDNSEKEFVKDINKRDGQVEVIKVLENGHRHREVIKTLEEGNRDIDKIKVDHEAKIVGKDKDEANKEVLKAKDRVEGEQDRAKEVIRK